MSTTMSKATNTPTPSRRGLLAGSGVGALIAGIGVPAGATSAIAATSADPVVALYAKWRAVEDQYAALDQQHVALRGAFVAQHGEILEVADAVAGWCNDSRRADLTTLTDRCNDLSDESAALIDIMMEMAATSLEGIRCKLIVGLDVWKFIEKPGAEPDYAAWTTVAFLRDAVRVLGGSVAA